MRTSIKKIKVDKLVLKCGLGSRWPGLKSGNFTTNDDVLKDLKLNMSLLMNSDSCRS